MNRTYMGIDLGTSGCRACLIDDDGIVLAEARVELAEPVRQGNAIEQDAELWWQAVLDVLKQLATSPSINQLQSISVDGTSSTTLALDKHDNPLGPALMYNDSRATEQAGSIASVAPPEAAVFGASSSLSKILWLKQHYPAAKRYCHQADYILHKLGTPTLLSDQNNCLKTGFDPVAACWPDWLSKLGVDTDSLPEVLMPGEIAGQLAGDIKQLLNVTHDVKLVAGTTDSIAGFLATGANEAGDAVTSLGSTIAVKIISEQPIFAPEYGIYSHRLNNQWLAGGASNAGGAVLKNFFSSDQVNQLTQQLDFRNPTGLEYYPLLSTGERFPVNDAKLEPKLSPRGHDIDFFQGILEALTAIEKQGYHKLAELGAGYPAQVFTVGGGTHNRKWMRYREQELGTPVIIPRNTEACYGTALLARQAITSRN